MCVLIEKWLIISFGDSGAYFNKLTLDKMVFTAGQQTSFFEDAAQMGLSNRTRLQLQAEGIVDVDDLAEWKTEEWDAFASNCRSPPRIPDPDNPAILIHQQAFSVPVRSLQRLKIASGLVRHYRDTARSLSAANMQWSTQCGNFHVQRKAMDDAIKKDAPSVPKLKKGGSVTKWESSMKVNAKMQFGTRCSDLTYLMRKDADVPAVAPVLAPGMPYTVEGGSIQADMESRLSLAHPLYQLDNEMFFNLIEEAVRDSDHPNTIKPFERRRDGRGAWLAMMGNHAGDDKWDRLIETAENYINKRKWDGSGSLTLESHIDRLKSAYIDLEAAKDHVPYVCPTDRTRVKTLLSSLDACTDPGMQAVMATIKNPNGGMVDDFEGSCRLLLPNCPVAKKHGTKRSAAQISSTNGHDGKSNLKVGTGPSGVEYRYYKPHLFKKLTTAQKDDLKAYRKKNHGKGRTKSGGGPSVSFEKQLKGKVASMVKKQVAEHVAAAEKADDDDKNDVSKIASILVSFGAQNGSPPTAASSTKDELAMAAAVSINKIVKRKRDNP